MLYPAEFCSNDAGTYKKNTAYLCITLLFKCHGPQKYVSYFKVQDDHDFFCLLCERLQQCELKAN